EIGPAPPALEDLQIVAAHQPDETKLGEAALQRAQRVDGIMRTQRALDVHHDDARMAREILGLPHAVLERQEPCPALERVLRRHQPPYIVEAQPLERDLADIDVAVMGGIERAAEQPDAQARRHRSGRLEPMSGGARRSQGLTCPVPRTTYLKVVSCSMPT